MTKSNSWTRSLGIVSVWLFVILVVVACGNKQSSPQEIEVTRLIEVTRIVVVTATPTPTSVMDGSQGESSVAEVKAATITPAASEVKVDEEEARSIDPVIALERMKRQVDNITGNVTYVDQETSSALYRSSSGESQFYLLIIEVNEQPFLFLRLHYVGDGWLFVENVLIKAGEVLHEVTPVEEFSRNIISGSRVEEWASIPIDSDNVDMIKDILNSDYTIVRFNGSQSYVDMLVSRQPKRSMRNVLDAFQALGGRVIGTRDEWTAQTSSELQTLIVGQWEKSSTGDLWTFSPDGELTISNTEMIGSYKIVEDGKIEMMVPVIDTLASYYPDGLAVDMDVAIHENQMFHWNGEFTEFSGYHRIE